MSQYIALYKVLTNYCCTLLCFVLAQRTKTPEKRTKKPNRSAIQRNNGMHINLIFVLPIYTLI